MNKKPECRHEFGPIELSRFAGNPNRRCKKCGLISLDLYDDDDESAREPLDEFTRSYLNTALWSSTNDDDEPLDANYGIDDIADEFIQSARIDCLKFQSDNASILIRYDASQSGHDFWLTRNGHGAGFWDGDYEIEPDDGDALTNASRSFEQIDLYIGDDGLIYG